MPVEIKDFVWKQSNEKISVNVPLKGIHYKYVDILISKNYIKLSFPPFIFENFLRHEIDEVNSKCYFTNDEAVLELIKDERIIWEKLEADINKKEKIKLKLQIIENIQNKTRKDLDEKIKLKTELSRFAVSEAIQLDTKRRNEIDAKRNLERSNAMTDLENWRQSKSITSNSQVPMLECANETKGVIITEITNDEDIAGNGDGQETNRESHNKIKEQISKSIPKKSNFYKKVMTDIETRVIPAPRQTCNLTVSFTERIFPTPCRESSARDEEIWLKNITEAKRATGFFSEDLRPEEHDPQWCKEKGDEFYKSENYLGAISAYSHGIKLSKNLASLYSNRSACHFALGNFNKCIEDCSTALDLLRPPCQANLSSRVKCITRRAAALTRIGMLNKAIDEMKAAIRLQPDNVDLKNDLYTMERAWEQDPDSD